MNGSGEKEAEDNIWITELWRERRLEEGVEGM